MGSRRIVLLSKGFLSGRLNFTYPNPYSHIREEYILSLIEAEEIAEVLKLRVLLQSQYISVSPKEGSKATQKILSDYIQLALPYAASPSTVVTKSNTKPPESLEEWKAILDTINK